ncbi:HET-domain-containing protein [Apiospora arundinis]|uniref:HET-domain-containing protein n=1 Tax=Apiospora arundinis TaxID=335852 RepID=A0ABR2JKP9_9PEZI
MDCSAPEPPVQQEEPVSDTALTAEELQSWYEYYRIVGTRPLYAMDQVRLSVEADKLNHQRIELRIRRLASSLSVVQEFCARCQDLLDHWPHFEPGLSDVDVYGRTVDTLKMEAASRLGCKLCTFLLWRLRAEGALDVYRKAEGRLQALKMDFTSSLFVNDHSELVYLNLPGFGRIMTIRSSMRFTYAARTNFHIMDPSANFREMKSLDMVKKWLRYCDDNHPSCRIKEQPRPTRLIYLGSDKLRLVLTREMDQIPSYATLSYCWGLEPFTMLRRDTFDAFMDEISASELPKTFGDAIHIARELGISYIWIDALCIIQGDNHDWEQEAGRMRYVYGGSYLNIAATFATSAHGGCFDEPENYYNNGLIVRVTSSDHSRVQAFHSPADHGTTTTRSTLATRAWAFQERILSPRTLYCGSLGLFWKCKFKQGSEFLPEESLSQLNYYEFTCPSKDDWDWDKLVEHYSGTILTHSSDRLPALSGIAMRECETREDQYLAGMWRKRLVNSLLWGRAWSSKRQRAAGQAPTWSWASIEGRVRFLSSWLGGNYKPRIRVLDAWTTPSGPDPFGPVSGGELTLACASLLRGDLDSSTEQVHLEVLKAPKFGPLRRSTIQVPVHMDCINEEESQNNRPVYLLPVYTIASCRALGLVLQRCCGDRIGHFRRIASFAHLDPASKEPPEQGEVRKILLGLIVHVGPQTAEAECNRVIAEPEYQDSPYVITIE